MIERETIKKKLEKFEIERYISDEVDKPGYSHTEIQRTPLGEKITIHTSKPGLIVGRGGESIRSLTEVLKKRFGLENPQIEVNEVENPFLNPDAVAKNIVHSFNRFGPRRFKLTGYRMLKNVIDAGALGAEIVIAGRGVPSSRSRTWRFSAGYLKKSGDISENHILKSSKVAHLKSGSIGIKVSILTPDVDLPDKIIIFDNEVKVEEVKEEAAEEVKKEVVEKKEEKTTKKKESKSKELKEKPEVKKEEKTTKKEATKEVKEEVKEEVVEKKEEKTKKVPTASELKEKQDGNNKKE